jgi:hypothetical protein
MTSDTNPYSHTYIDVESLPEEWRPTAMLIAHKHNTLAQVAGQAHGHLHNAIGQTDSEMDESNKVLLAGRKIAHWVIRKGGWLILAPLASACLTFTGEKLGIDLTWVGKSLLHFVMSL